MTVVTDAWRVIGLQHRSAANHPRTGKMTGGLSGAETDEPTRVSDRCHAWRVIGDVRDAQEGRCAPDGS